MVQFFLHIKLFSLSFSISSCSAPTLIASAPVWDETRKAPLWTLRSSLTLIRRRRRRQRTRQKTFYCLFANAPAKLRAIDVLLLSFARQLMSSAATIHFFSLCNAFSFSLSRTTCHFFLKRNENISFFKLRNPLPHHGWWLSTPSHWPCQCNQNPYTVHNKR